MTNILQARARQENQKKELIVQIIVFLIAIIVVAVSTLCVHASQVKERDIVMAQISNEIRQASALNSQLRAFTEVNDKLIKLIAIEKERSQEYLAAYFGNQSADFALQQEISRIRSEIIEFSDRQNCDLTDLPQIIRSALKKYLPGLFPQMLALPSNST
jgi:hypothetical protein